MSNEINLLNSKKAGGNVRLQAQVKILRVIAVGLLFTIGVGSLVIFILILASPLPSLKNQENQLLQSMAQLHSKVIKQVLIVTRLDDINQIIKNRHQVDKRIAKFEELLPIGSEIKEVSVNEKSISLSMYSNSLGKIESYTSSLKSLRNSDKSMKEIHIESFQYVPGELYLVSYRITL